MPPAALSKGFYEDSRSSRRESTLNDAWDTVCLLLVLVINTIVATVTSWTKLPSSRVEASLRFSIYLATMLGTAKSRRGRRERWLRNRSRPGDGPTPRRRVQAEALAPREGTVLRPRTMILSGGPASLLRVILWDKDPTPNRLELQARLLHYPFFPFRSREKIPSGTSQT